MKHVRVDHEKNFHWCENMQSARGSMKCVLHCETYVTYVCLEIRSTSDVKRNWEIGAHGSIWTFGPLIMEMIRTHGLPNARTSACMHYTQKDERRD